MRSLPIPAFYSPIIPKEIMTYKQQMRQNELITKIRIIRYVRKEHVPIAQVALAFSAHRNTVGSILKTFDEKIAPEDRGILLNNGTSLTQEDLAVRYGALRKHTTRPHGNSRSADKAAEETIIDLFTRQKI